MNTTEKLAKIRAKCVELLEIASKRTPGEWKACAADHEYFIETQSKCLAEIYSPFGKDSDDSRYIAACAGPAEAGWRATIAAIDGLSQPMPEGYYHPDNPVMVFDHKLASEILTAWEGLYD